MAKKSVDFRRCACGKRGFLDEHDADKALGRAQSKRRRALSASSNRRGVVKMESHVYECEVGDLWHTSSMSRREYNETVLRTAPMTWEQFQASRGGMAA